MSTLATIGKIVLIVFAVANVLFPLFSERKRYKFVWQVWTLFRVRTFFACFAVVAITLVVGASLMHFVPVLRFGWSHLFLQDGGNIFIAPIAEGTESSSVFVRLLVPLFLIAFALGMPFIAHAEEKLFRKRCTTWKAVVRQALVFGPIHCLVGVPPAFGVALIVPGLYFGSVFKKTFHKLKARGHNDKDCTGAAILYAAVHHTMMNTIIIGGGVLMLVLHELV